MRTAGMVNGTPDWQLDMMYENESAMMWEAQQEQPKANPLERFDFDALNAAHAHLSVPELDCKSIVDFIGRTIDEIPGTPEADKLASLADEVSDIYAEIKKIREKLYGLMFPSKAVNE